MQSRKKGGSGGIHSRLNIRMLGQLAYKAAPNTGNVDEGGERYINICIYI